MQAKDYTLEKLPSFPRTLFHFRQYDGWKSLTVMILVFTSVYMVMGLVGYALDHNLWVQKLVFGPTPEPTIENHWWTPVLFWTKPIGAVTKEILSAADLLFRGLMFLCSYCLAWAAFDPKNIEGYIMGLFNMIVGLVYMLSPMDIVPDILPVLGSIDDTLFSGGMFGLGAYMFSRNLLQSQKTATILDMVNHNSGSISAENMEKALQLMLEDRGVSLKFAPADQDNTSPTLNS